MPFIIFDCESGAAGVGPSAYLDIEIARTRDEAIKRVEKRFLDGPSFLKVWITKSQDIDKGMSIPYSWFPPDEGHPTAGPVISDGEGFELVYDQDQGDYDAWSARLDPSSDT